MKSYARINSRNQAGVQVHTHLRVGGNELLQRRLNELNAEYAIGQQRMAELRSRESNLRDVLCHLEGAIPFAEG